MNTVEETLTVARLYHGILYRVNKVDTEFRNDIDCISKLLSESVCIGGLCRDTNLDLIFMIEQLASFRAGIKSPAEFTEAMQKHFSLTMRTDHQSHPSITAQAIAKLSKASRTAKNAITLTPPPSLTPPVSPFDTFDSSSSDSITTHSPKILSEEPIFQFNSRQTSPFINEKEESVDDNESIKSSDDRVMVSLTVPANKVSYLIGPSGTTMKDLMITTNTKFDIIQSGYQKRAVIRGTPNCCQDAVSKVKKIITEPHYTEGVLYETSNRFLTHRGAFEEVCAAATSCFCDVRELHEPGFGRSCNYLFITGDSKVNIYKCMKKINELENTYLGYNSLEGNYTVLSPQQGVVTYKREDILKIKDAKASKIVPVFPEEAVEMEILETLPYSLQVTNTQDNQ